MRCAKKAVKIAAAVAAILAIGTAASARTSAGESLARECEIPGGLCVVLGAGDAALACDLGQTGRFLVQMLHADADTVARLREAVDAKKLYGPVSVEQFDPAGRSNGGAFHAPYAENLVNLLVVDGSAKVPAAEIRRVLCPRGMVAFAGDRPSAESLRAAGFEDVRPVAGNRFLAARKPWPPEMDEWTHARHAADGNAVSGDRLVGPPRRVRWISGPFCEINNVVSARGRNFYGGVWARDAFNGLRLWQAPLNPSPARGGFSFQYAPGSVPPIVAGDRLFVVTGGTVQALDGATGKSIARYDEAGKPSELLHAAGTLLAVDDKSVRAVEVDSGKLRWKHEGSKPRYVVAGDGGVFLMEGADPRGEKCAAVCLDPAAGVVRWKRDDLDWLAKVRRLVCHGDLLALEVSTLADAKEGNTLHVVSAVDGRLLWSRTFVPSMNHMKQARAMFVGDLLWVADDRKCVALDPRTGEPKRSFPAGLCHCFPPVATCLYMLCGEIEMTHLASGVLDANHITKAACGRDFGWMPANGLLYMAPKHCVCWPMLRGYTALAPASPDRPDVAKVVEKRDFVLQTGVAPPADAPATTDDDWPCYRRDARRSGSTPSKVPAELKNLWKTDLGGWPDGPIADDWRENPFVCGPVTAPVIVGKTVFVARPDAHQVVALDAESGAVRWRYTADGRVDTSPTIHRGLCLFGVKSGWVCCLRADDGRLVWRLRAAPCDEQIAAYGQLESPWPVPGSVLVIDDVAYFAAGRQPLADSGILVFAVEPATGKIRWVSRLDTLPMKGFYNSCALEFDNFDLLQREGDSVAMARWLFARTDGKMTCKAADGFARQQGDGFNVVVPRSLWSYAPRNLPRVANRHPQHRPLVVFRGNTLLGCSQDLQTVFRRDFDAESVAKFDTTWITGWAASENQRKKEGDVWRNDRLSRDAKWSVPVFGKSEPDKQVAAMVLAGDTLFLAGADGGLQAVSPEDGRVLAGADLAAPVWDGLAAAAGRLFATTRDGAVVCLGGK